MHRESSARIEASHGTHHMVSKVSQHGSDGGDSNSSGDEEQRAPDISWRQEEIPTDLELHFCTWALLHMPAFQSIPDSGTGQAQLIGLLQKDSVCGRHLLMQPYGRWVAGLLDGKVKCAAPLHLAWGRAYGVPPNLRHVGDVGIHPLSWCKLQQAA